MKNLELIDKYFNNSLSPEEHLRFNELLQNDENFKIEFLFQKDLKKAIIQNERDNLKESLRNFERNVKPNPKLLMTHKKWLAAASIILLLGLGSIMIKSNFYPSAEKLYVDNFEPYRNIIQPIVRGEDLNTIEYRAFLAYENENYHKAINLFNSIENQNSVYIPFYKAICYLSLDKTTEAITLLEPLSLNSYSEYHDKKLGNKSHWFLGLAYLKSGSTAKAVSSFEEIVNQPCKVCKRKKRAQNILKHIG